ncbi:MAG: carboxypeptidase-like regulatory domain-containing protein [Croceitalea sp.]|nr:carboxypeptidase-like regulatory domain-containing protein [Croceitalea sp.]
MKNNLLLVCSIFCAHICLAQTFEIKTLKGKVYAQEGDITGVVVQNISSQSAVITDIDGNFSIQVQLNDTLVFSAIQFKKKVLPINQSILKSPFISIPLEEFVNELREVVVRPFDLSGDLGTDVVDLNLAKDVSAEALGLPNAQQKIPTQSERKLQQATYGKFNLGMILSPPLDPIINAITGRTKMLKNRVKVDAAYARTQRVQNFYTDSIFMADLKIPIEKIEDFMYFCEVDNAFQKTVDTHDKLKIWEFLVQKSRLYRENNNLD